MPWIVVLVCLLFAGGVEAQKWTIERDSDPLTGAVSLKGYLSFSHGYLGRNQNNRMSSYLHSQPHTDKEILESGKHPWGTLLSIACARLENVGRIGISVVIIANRRYFVSEKGMSGSVWKFGDSEFHRDRLQSRYSQISKGESLAVGSHILDVPQILLSDFAGHTKLQFRIEEGPVMPEDWTVTFDLSRSEPVIKEALGICGDSAKTD